jgi:hypothetical protein
MPFIYHHRQEGVVWIAGMIAFAAVPVFFGILQSQANYSLAVAAAILLLLSPIVYAATDPLDKHFEKLRDGHFLATGATIIFVSTAWLTHSVRERNWTAFAAATLASVVANLAVFVLLWIVLYLE